MQKDTAEFCRVFSRAWACCYRQGGPDMKLRIIGGSGKTYLARRLAQEYDIPHVELDKLQWDSGATLLRSLR